jgi:hypothetical protein
MLIFICRHLKVRTILDIFFGRCRAHKAKNTLQDPVWPTPELNGAYARRGTVRLTMSHEAWFLRSCVLWLIFATFLANEAIKKSIANRNSKHTSSKLD